MTLEQETSIYQLGAIAAGIQGAVSIAESKNSIFHQATAPPTSGRKVGDIWYDSDDGYAMYKFDGTGWTQEQFGTNAISAGSVTAARLDAQDVYTNFLRVYFLSAAQAEIESLSAITANLGSVIVGGLNNEDGVITIKDASNQTIGFWDNTGINAQAGTIGGWTVGTETLESSGVINNTTYSAVLQNLKGTSLSRNAFYIHVTPYGTPDYYPFYVQYDGTVGMRTCVVSRAIIFQSFNDSALLINSYGNDTYNLIRNHNNGDISISASSGTLYLGYENTASVQSNCLIYAATAVLATAASGEAYIQARNSGTGNRIYMWSNSNGVVGLASYGANNIQYQILERANNSGVITAYGDWVFSRVVPWKTDIKGRPMISDSADGHRVSLLTSGASGQVGIQAQFGSTGTTYSIGYFNVAASDIRLKKNIEDSTIDALSLINAIKVRKFDWKDGRHQRIGMIADELEELDKALTIGGGYTDDNEMSIKSVDTFYLVGYLVKAVQELSDEVKRLKGAA